MLQLGSEMAVPASNPRSGRWRQETWLYNKTLSHIYVSFQFQRIRYTVLVSEGIAQHRSTNSHASKTFIHIKIKKIKEKGKRYY